MMSNTESYITIYLDCNAFINNCGPKKLVLFNSLTRKMDQFVPINGNMVIIIIIKIKSNQISPLHFILS